MDKPLKILMLNYEFPPIGGGAGNAHLHLLNEYTKQTNLDVDVLTSCLGTENIIESFGENITIHKIGIHKKNLHFWKKTEVIEWLFKAKKYYNKLTKNNEYNLIHAFFAFPSGYLCLKTAQQIPYIISLRGSDVPGYNQRLKLDYYLLKGLFRKIWKKADAVIANSKGLAELAEKFEPSIGCGVICNGIDTNKFSPPPTRNLTMPIKLLTVCRLISRKRIHILIEAVSLLKQQGINTELNIVGDGNLLDELKTQAAQQNIADCVNFLGLVEYDKIPSVYQQNHFFLMSSTHEGMSNAMLEAMASGLPIITSSCEGTDELIDKNGKVISNAAPENFAKAITQIVNDPEAYTAMAEHSRRTAEDFSWSKTAEQYLQIYKNTIT